MRLTALLLAVVSFAAAPKAEVKGPSVVQVGSLVMLDTSGTVSDSSPEVLLWPGADGDGPEFDSRGALLGWRLNHAGEYTFFVIAAGVPPGSTVLVRSVANCKVTALPGTRPPPVRPLPPVPVSDPLVGAARVYLAGIPVGFRQTAADVRAGKTTTVDGVITSMTDRRKLTGQPLAAEMDRRFKTMADPSGKITDLAGVAALLESAAAAMEAPSP